MTAFDFKKHAEFPLGKIGVPARYHESLLKADTLNPGLESASCKFILENLHELEAGNMLILSGAIGCGKTFAGLLAAMIFVAGRTHRNLDPWVEYRLGDEIEHPARSVYVNPGGSGRVISSREVLKNALTDDHDQYAEFEGLLMIDDLGYEYFTDKGFGIAEWDFLFDTRYSGQLPTIITANLTPQELIEKYNRRIYDRLKECAVWYQDTGSSLRKTQLTRANK